MGSQLGVRVGRLLIVAVAGAATLSGVADPASGVTAPSFKVVASPALPAGGNLEAVTTFGEDIAWASGGVVDEVTGADVTSVLERWNGHNWQLVPVPATATGGLNSLAAVGPDEVWATGYGGAAPLLLHGSSHGMTQVAIPGMPAGFLNAISGAGPHDVWTVGGRTFEDALPTIEHWDGHTWSPVPFTLPSGVDEVYLESISAVAAHDVWASGWKATAHVITAYAAHWDGHAWTEISPAGQSEATPVSANAKHVWTSAPRQALELTGSTWTLLPAIPLDPTKRRSIDSISGDLRGDLWTAGRTYPPSGSPRPTFPSLDRWDGHAWTNFAVPAKLAGGQTEFIAVASTPSGHTAWAVITNNKVRNLGTPGVAILRARV